MEVTSRPETMVVLTVTQARENLAELIDTTHRSGEPMVLTQGGRPVAVMLDHGVFERLLEAADEANDRETVTLAGQGD
jgi:prevent-host-death family protein